MTETTEPRAMRRLGLALPLLIFAALAGLFWFALQGGDPSRLPSAMIGKPVPNFTLPPLDGLTTDAGPVPSFGPKELTDGKPTLVNVFASWCVPCQEEHPVLMALSKRPDVRLYGINYKDDASGARRFLGRHGNPYQRVGVDSSGRVGIDFGVYGVPETYVIGGDGKIAYRHVGPLTEQDVKQKLLPLLLEATPAPQG